MREVREALHGRRENTMDYSWPRRPAPKFEEDNPDVAVTLEMMTTGLSATIEFLHAALRMHTPDVRDLHLPLDPIRLRKIGNLSGPTGPTMFRTARWVRVRLRAFEGQSAGTIFYTADPATHGGIAALCVMAFNPEAFRMLERPMALTGLEYKVDGQWDHTLALYPPKGSTPPRIDRMLLNNSGQLNPVLIP